MEVQHPVVEGHRQLPEGGSGALQFGTVGVGGQSEQGGQQVTDGLAPGDGVDPVVHRDIVEWDRSQAGEAGK